MKAVFLGTPEFAVPSLEAMVQAGYTIEAVYTQPDRPKGRGQELAESPVKVAARRLGVAAIRQPERVRMALDELREIAPEVMVVVGYGQIIPQSIIDIPRLGILNVHGSLLPKYRGAAPIQWAIANGETVSGVTTMQIDAGLDTGPTILTAELPIGPDETAPEYSVRLAAEGARILVDTIPLLERGFLPSPQNDAEHTLAPILTRDDGKVDWSWPVRRIYARYRGFSGWPGTWTMFRGQKFTIARCRPAEGPARPGELAVEGRRLFAGGGDQRRLELLEVQLEGRKRVTAEAFLNGVRMESGERLGA